MINNIINRRKQLVIISDGMGQDSQAIAILACEERDRFLKLLDLNEDDDVEIIALHAETNDEHPRTVEHRKWKDAYYFLHDIHYGFITPEMGHHAKNWQSLISHYRSKKSIGSKAYKKSCSDQLKLRPIYLYLEEYISKKYGTRNSRKKGFDDFKQKHGDIHVILGIEYGEAGRRMGKNKKMPKWMQRNITFHYPLVELKWNRKELQEYIIAKGHELAPPSNCMRCPFMSEQELLWLMKFHFDKYEEWVELEQAKIDHYRNERYYCLDCKKGIPPNNFPQCCPICGKAGKLGYPDKINFGVWGRARKDKQTKKYYPITLPMVAENSEHNLMTKEQLDEYKMSHGHCVATVW